MNRFFVALALALCFASSPIAHAADWRQFRGPNGDGVSPDAKINTDWNAKPPAVLWTFRLSDGGWSNPCIGDNSVFIIDHVTTETKDAEGKSTGKKGEDIVRALSLKTGEEIWHFAYPGLSQDKNGTTGASPALDNGKLYTISRNMLVHCLDAKTGKKIWERDGTKDFAARPSERDWGHNASPLIDGNQLIIVPGGPEAAVVALDKNTGETLWKAPGSNAGHASPIIYGSGKTRQYVAFIAEGLVGLDPQTGKRLWAYAWKTTNGQNSATPVIMDKRIFFTSAWKMGSGLLDITDVTSPTLVWKNKDLGCRFSSPVCVKGNLYGTSDPENPGNLVCIDAKTGKTNWKQSGFHFGPVGAAGGAIVVVDGKTGDVALVEANSAAYKELGRIRSAEPNFAWNTPIVVDGKMFVRTKKVLTCYNVAP